MNIWHMRTLRHNTKLQEEGTMYELVESMIARKAFYLIIDDAIMAKTSLCDWRFRVCFQSLFTHS